MEFYYFYIVLALFSFRLGVCLVRWNFISRCTIPLASIAIIIPSTPFLVDGNFLFDISMHILCMVLFQLGIFTEVVIESVRFWAHDE